MLLNTCYAVRNVDGGRGGVICKSIISYSFDAIGDYCIWAASNKGITFCFNYRIAIVTAIVSGVTIFHNYGSKVGAITKNSLSNARNTIADSDGGKGRTKPESIIPNTLYAIGDSNRGKGGATRESALSNNIDAVWDYGILAASYKGITCCFDYRIAIFTAIIVGVSIFHDYGSE